MVPGQTELRTICEKKKANCQAGECQKHQSQAAPQPQGIRPVALMCWRSQPTLLLKAFISRNFLQPLAQSFLVRSVGTAGRASNQDVGMRRWPFAAVVDRVTKAATEFSLEDGADPRLTQGTIQVYELSHLDS
jgi:hypothetical protein